MSILGLLDAPVAAAVSTRRLGSVDVCLRVRRSSDNAEQDFGFVGTNTGAPLDTAALLSFCGSGSGYVTRFYDQSGGAGDRTFYQTTQSKQPRIVASGGFDDVNGHPALWLDSASLQCMTMINTTTATLGLSNAPYEMMAVSAPVGGGVTYFVVGSTLTERYEIHQGPTRGLTRFVPNSGTPYADQAGFDWIGQPAIVGGRQTATQAICRRDGVDGAAQSKTPVAAVANLHVGIRTAISLPFKGHVVEAIWCAGVLGSASRLAYEAASKFGGTAAKWPSPADVKAGVTYGLTGTEYVGTRPSTGSRSRVVNG